MREEIRIAVLGSGSSGNCAFVGCNGRALLIDAGLPAEKILSRLKATAIDPSSIEGILLTHEHGDHAGGAAALSNLLSIPIFANCATSRAARIEARVRDFQTGTSFSLAGFSIFPFPIPHDAADPVGFTLSTERHKIGLVTDLGSAPVSIVEALAGSEALILEFNHDLEMLKRGPYPASLKSRLLGPFGHLSNDDSAELLSRVLHPRMSHLFLAHLSRVNNHPDLALFAAEKIGRRAGLEPAIHVCRQDFPTRPISL